MLASLAPAVLFVEIDPTDAEPLGIRSGRTVIISSRHGELTARAYVTPTVGPGRLFLPMHNGTTNRLTAPVFDPHSRQPSYKYVAVRVQPAPDDEHDSATSHGDPQAP